MDKVILVDTEDNAIGEMEKLEAHQKGLLHRAFSILVFNSKGEMLLQKRAQSKYHSGGLWTNACCSHPIPGENILETVRQRLYYEMGIDVSPSLMYKFTYQTSLDKNLIEHEVDYVYTAVFDGIPQANPAEVEDWKFINLDTLQTEVINNSHLFTSWFKLIINHQEFQDSFVISK
jgi:isopentenyl-diphosphate delta-isomerase